MNCPLQFVSQDGDRFLHRCRKCKAEVRSKYADPSMHKRTCGTAGPPELADTLPANDRQVFEQAAKQEGKLLGDYIADMTKAIGIPPCGGCEKRRQWLNAAHRWVLGRSKDSPASTDQPSTSPEVPQL